MPTFGIFAKREPAVIESTGAPLDFDISEFGLMHEPDPESAVWPAPPKWLVEMALESTDASECEPTPENASIAPVSKNIKSVFGSLDADIDFEQLTQFHKRVAALAKATVMLSETDVLLAECVAYFNSQSLAPHEQALIERLQARRQANANVLVGLD
jgi:hypothetical protein